MRSRPTVRFTRSAVKQRILRGEDSLELHETSRGRGVAESGASGCSAANSFAILCCLKSGKQLKKIPHNKEDDTACNYHGTESFFTFQATYRFTHYHINGEKYWLDCQVRYCGHYC